MSSGEAPPGFDSAAAATRSMLGWGVLAGPIYLTTGVILALTRNGFDLGEHQLSLLMLGDNGWIQRTNLIVSGALVLIAAVGVMRALQHDGSSRAPGVLLSAFGVGLIGSGIFPPDPVDGFPPGSSAETTASGILHLAFGGFQFVCLAAACFATARWMKRRGDASSARYSMWSGVIVLVGFIGGVALSQGSIGVLLLWIAVVACYLWIVVASVYAWHTVPHPDAHRRVSSAEG